MPARRVLTPEQEEQVWTRYLQRAPQTAIARELGVNRNTISRAIERIKRDLSAGRAAEMEDMRTEALAEYDTIKREAWDRLGKCSPASTAAVGYLGVIVDARQAQDRLLGLEEITVNHRGVHLARIETVLNTPIPVIIQGIADGEQNA